MWVQFSRNTCGRYCYQLELKYKIACYTFQWWPLLDGQHYHVSIIIWRTTNLREFFKAISFFQRFLEKRLTRKFFKNADKHFMNCLLTIVYREGITIDNNWTLWSWQSRHCSIELIKSRVQIQPIDSFWRRWLKPGYWFLHLDFKIISLWWLK